MRRAVHWQIALWNLGLVALSFLLFESRSRAVFFALVVLVGASVFVYRLRWGYVEPLRDLAEALKRAAGRKAVLPPVERGLGEVTSVSRALRQWTAEVTDRMGELADSRNRLESVLGAMVEGVLVFDSEARIILQNRAFRGLLDAQRDATGKTCLEVFRNERLDRAVWDALAGEAPEAVEFSTAPGRVVRSLVSPVPVEDGGRIEAAVMVLQDLTDIRQVDRVRRDFVANVSHEFKTPLTSIRGYAETMLSETSDPSHGEFLEIIHRNARYLESLVNGLLLLARIEAQPPSAVGEIDILSVVTEQVKLRKLIPDAEGFEIEVDCPPIRVRADSARLSMALSNLIDNAIRYSEPPGGIKVSGRRDGPYVVLTVADEGFGIPEDELPRIFERFYRVDKARTPSGGGTGLGLAIARHAIESQGGALTVESRVGKGSTFSIRLPAGQAAADLESSEVRESLRET